MMKRTIDCRALALALTWLALTACSSSSAPPAISAGSGGTGGSSQAGAAGGTASGNAGNASVTSGGNSSSAGGTSTIPTTITGDGKPFVPDDIKYVVVDGGGALTLVSATLVDAPDGLYWVIAVRNDEPSTVCLPQFNAAFMSAADVDAGNLGGESIVMVQGAVHQTKDLGPVPCLEPGEVGMGAQAVVPHNPGDPKTVEIDYQARGYLEPEAVKDSAIAVEGVKTAVTTAGTLVTGSVANHGTAEAPGPAVFLFPLDSGGRPIDFGYDSSTLAISPGASWSFQMTIPDPINKYATFPIYGQQN